MLTRLASIARIVKPAPSRVRSPGIPNPQTARFSCLRATMAATKRKRPTVNASGASKSDENVAAPPLKKRASTRSAANAATVNPDASNEVLDGPEATRASPDGDANNSIVTGGNVKEEQDVGVKAKTKRPSTKREKANRTTVNTSTPLDEAVPADATAAGSKGKAAKQNKSRGKAEHNGITPSQVQNIAAGQKTEDDSFDPEAEGSDVVDEEETRETVARPPPVNSAYLPLPWKGRLGYACLNTYLRTSNPPVFSSRTCRIQSILEHRHPLRDPTQPEHATKNRPDRNQPADVERGQRYVQELCLANVRDIIKMLRWNDKYGIKFLRLSSEMFPFASHPEYGYKLAPFASEALAEVGRVVAELGHRVTTHPGQFTQLGSPRPSVIDNAMRDLAYHDEMLSLLRLPEQQDRDAVMILHMGGVFESKEATLARFRANHARLSPSAGRRLVLENDDVSWSVHDLLPVCEALDIPLVLDFHHHNIIFDAAQVREGTHDVAARLFPRIAATWARKRIRQKMHYSESTPAATTRRQRRKHSPRVMTLPPCAPDMDLMIEAKDKEQAVFELMRTFKLPGFERIADIVPFVRADDNRVVAAEQAKRDRKLARGGAADASEDPPPADASAWVPEEDVGMGGPEGRVYWPPGMEEWLRPPKREVRKKSEGGAPKAKKSGSGPGTADADADDASVGAPEEDGADAAATPATKKARAALRKKTLVAGGAASGKETKPARGRKTGGGGGG